MKLWLSHDKVNKEPIYTSPCGESTRLISDRRFLTPRYPFSKAQIHRFTQNYKLYGSPLTG